MSVSPWSLTALLEKHEPRLAARNQNLNSASLPRNSLASFATTGKPANAKLTTKRDRALIRTSITSAKMSDKLQLSCSRLLTSAKHDKLKFVDSGLRHQFQIFFSSHRAGSRSRT